MTDSSLAYMHSASLKQISNYGEDFYIGFMRNFEGKVSHLQLVISAEGSSPVQFGVETSSGVVYTGTTTGSSSVTVNLPTSLQTNSAAYTFRNKGVHVYTTGQGSVSVLAINFQTGRLLGLSLSRCWCMVLHMSIISSQRLNFV